jgi:uncharacterized protein
MKNSVVVFTKVPMAGQSKTRLTTDRGGIFSPEEAREFYQASLLDVLDSCITAQCCDVYVCHDRAGDALYLKQILKDLTDPSSITEVFPDKGGTFDKGMQYAADYVLKKRKAGRLADSVLIIGGDMPTLQPATIQAAVRKLETLAGSAGSLKKGVASIGSAMVVSADQECGFNILGYTCTTPFSFDGVFYNLDGVTALDMISHKASENNIPLGILEIVPDVDVPVDLAGFISVAKTMQLAEKHDPSVIAPKRTIRVLEAMGIEASAPVPVDLRQAV